LDGSFKLLAILFTGFLFRFKGLLTYNIFGGSQQGKEWLVSITIQSQNSYDLVLFSAIPGKNGYISVGIKMRQRANKPG